MVCAEKANLQIIWNVKSEKEKKGRKERLTVVYIVDISLKIYLVSIFHANHILQIQRIGEVRKPLNYLLMTRGFPQDSAGLSDSMDTSTLLHWYSSYFHFLRHDQFMSLLLISYLRFMCASAWSHYKLCTGIASKITFR